MIEVDFRTIVAEPPYDAMGLEFAEIFGKWCNETVLRAPNEINQLAFGLFRMRLALAQKYHTYFAKQVTDNGQRELWKDRYAGAGNAPCYSFAIKNLQRTIRFWRWATQVLPYDNSLVSFRHWDTDYADFPTFPVKVTPSDPMTVLAHRYEPRFTARTGVSFECRIIHYGFDENSEIVYLFEHPRNRWISQIRAEATTFWNIAYDANNDQTARFSALASFEWLWNWMNQFMRSRALTSDALSLVMQKHIRAHSRTNFYHQDCEALLMTFDDYVEKRTNDMKLGFVEKFAM